MPTTDVLTLVQDLIKQNQALQEKLEAKIEAVTAREQAVAARESAQGDGHVLSPGQERTTNITLGESEQDRLMLGLDGFWAGENLATKDGTTIPRFRSLSVAYESITHRSWNPMQALREASALDLRTGHRYDAAGRDHRRMVEAIQTGSWAQVLGDSLQRRLLVEYARPDLQTWRPLCSEIGNVTDFRTQHRLRVGGYAELPVVGEGQSYTALTSPPDQEGTYQVRKRGGLEQITLEALSNDADLAVLRRTPQRLGRAAARSLYYQFFDMLRLNQVLTFNDDTTALFTVAHKNTTAGLALDVNGLNTAILGLSQQTEYGVATEVLGLRPKFLLHASNLRPTVHQLLNTSNVPQTADYGANQFLQFGINPIEIFYWPNDLWVLCADPADASTAEVGFFHGQEQPEIFQANQENVEGSQFYSDQVSFKIRFIFGTMIGDFRSWYSNQ